jgi:hypothetical protein
MEKYFDDYETCLQTVTNLDIFRPWQYKEIAVGIRLSARAQCNCFQDYTDLIHILGVRVHPSHVRCSMISQTPKNM